MIRLTDQQFAEYCRKWELNGFLQLVELLGDDLAVAKAVRAEGEFVETAEWAALKAPRTLEFACQVRIFMIENKLAWNSETLLTACKFVMGREEAAQ